MPAAMQAIKKAKAFEIRKVSRRLKQVLDSQSKDGKAGGSQAGAAEKFQHQLVAAKGLEVDTLIAEVYTYCVHVSSTEHPLVSARGKQFNIQCSTALRFCVNMPYAYPAGSEIG